MAKNAIELYGDSGVAARAATAQVSDAFELAADGYATAVISITNGLDQNVTATIQGKNDGDSAWQTVDTQAVSASSSGYYMVTTPWGLIRLSTLPAGIPTTGSLQARATKVSGASSSSSGGSGSTVVTNITGIAGIAGQKTMANSFPVVVASDQSALSADVSDRAARDLGKVDIAGIDAVGGAAGQAAMAASFPVVIASDQSNVGVDVSDRAARDLGKVDIAGIDAVGGVAGQKAKAASIPVTLASDEDLLTSIVLAAGANLIGLVQPHAAMTEGGLTELVGINEQVDQNEYGASVGVALGGTYSGEILSIMLYATEDGSGAVQDSAGTLFLFDADPSISAGDAAMSAAARVSVVAQIPVYAGDWKTDANGGSVSILNKPIPFHGLSTLYFAWFHTDATSLNDAAGDDEQLEMNCWYRRDS